MPNLSDYIRLDALARSSAMLVEWQVKYSQAVLPEKIVKNIFYELLTLEAFFPKIYEGFVNRDELKQDIGIQQSVDLLWSEYRKFQSLVIRDRMQNIVNTELSVEGIISYDDFSDLILSAKNQDNKSLEMLEDNYKWICLTKNIMLHWGALPLMISFEVGDFQDQNYESSAIFDKACILVTGGIMGGVDYRKFASVWGAFTQLSSFS